MLLGENIFFCNGFVSYPVTVLTACMALHNACWRKKMRSGIRNTNKVEEMLFHILFASLIFERIGLITYVVGSSNWMWIITKMTQVQVFTLHKDPSLLWQDLKQNKLHTLMTIITGSPILMFDMVYSNVENHCYQLHWRKGQIYITCCNIQ